jgi:hypothetical protein
MTLTSSWPFPLPALTLPAPTRVPNGGAIVNLAAVFRSGWAITSASVVLTVWPGKGALSGSNTSPTVRATASGVAAVLRPSRGEALAATVDFALTVGAPRGASHLAVKLQCYTATSDLPSVLESLLGLASGLPGANWFAPYFVPAPVSGVSVATLLTLAIDTDAFVLGDQMWGPGFVLRVSATGSTGLFPAIWRVLQPTGADLAVDLFVAIAVDAGFRPMAVTLVAQAASTCISISCASEVPSLANMTLASVRLATTMIGGAVASFNVSLNAVATLLLGPVNNPALVNFKVQSMFSSSVKVSTPWIVSGSLVGVWLNPLGLGRLLSVATLRLDLVYVDEVLN